MPDSDLKDLTKLTVQFNLVVEARLSRAGIEDLMIKKADEEELYDFCVLQASQAIEVLFGDMDDDAMRTKISIADLYQKMAQRVMDKEELLELLPNELASEDTVQKFRDLGADTLASLCEQKLQI